MWLIVMFDLPVTSKQHRRQYTHFRKALVKKGFEMLQYSVYARFFASEESAQPYRTMVRAILPPSGQVRLLAMTDRQFAKMEIFFGKKREPSAKPPPQLLLF